MANRTFTVTISADSDTEVQDAIIALADSLPDPDHIAAVRLGDCYAEVDLMPRPVDPKRLH